MCGIIGISGLENAVSDIYQGLIAIQHRGQDAAGIMTYDEMFHLKKGIGQVMRVFHEKNLSRLKGNIGIGHVRYPTTGAGGFEDAQPFYVNTPYGIAMAHNGNVTNYFTLKKELAERSFRHLNSSCDVEAILNLLADELTSEMSDFTVDRLSRALERVFQRVHGSYSVVGMVAEKGLFAFRDPHGIKPLAFGSLNNSFAFASESVAFDILSYKMERDVRPGEVIFIDRKRRIHSKILASERHTPCIFEWIYFARPDSIIDGIPVYAARMRLGESLAEEVKRANITPDVIVPVPDTARPAAISLSDRLGIPLREGLIKNRYIARTFIMPTQEERLASIRQKLNPIRSEMEGRRVLLVDDSIVRGTTSREIVSLVRSAHAKAVYLAVTSPPLRYPCVYGIDMQTRGELIAKSHAIPEIQRKINADALIYQTLTGLTEAVAGAQRERTFCTGCFSGIYPTEVTEETLLRIERERIHFQRDRSRTGTRDEESDN